MNDDYFFEGGYAELYLYKFKQYESSVGKYIRDQQLKNYPYRYDEVNIASAIHKNSPSCSQTDVTATT